MRRIGSFPRSPTLCGPGFLISVERQPRIPGHYEGHPDSVAGGGERDPLRVVNQQNLLQNRAYQLLNDYRDMLVGLFARLWGRNTSQLQPVFPQMRARDLRLV